MSSTDFMEEEVLSPRRSARERKQTEHFGHSAPTIQLEELIEDHESSSIASVTRKAEEQATERLSLVVKLPLATTTLEETVQLPSFPTDLAPKSRTEENIKAEAATSNKAVKKRGLGSLVDDEEDFGLSATSSKKGSAPKRQRLSQASQAASKARAASTVQGNIISEGDSRPQPRGQPQVWAEGRQALCESLPYYQAFHSAAYSWGSSPGFAGYVYGYLLDNDNEEYGYMDEKVVITRLGGGMKATKDGDMEQTEDHSCASRQVTPILNNLNNHMPVVLIVGAKNAHCPVKVPHRYNVLGLYHVTDVWSEKVKGKVVCRARFEMLDLKSPSWCGVQGAPLPPRRPDFTSKAQVSTCASCHAPSKQVFAAGWACLNETCPKFANGANQAARAWNPVFIGERNRWPAHIIAPMQIKPPPPTAPLDGALVETSLQAWKGMVCPQCGRCNSRTKWDEWRCCTVGCNYNVPIQYQIIPRSLLAPDHAFEAEGHSIPFDKCMEPVIRTGSDFLGFWRKLEFQVAPGNTITHYLANEVINRQPGGPDSMLARLQGERLGMQRFALGSCAVEGEMITKHFGMNFGLPYKYIVAIDSRSFSEAPPPIMDALNHLTWAGKDAITDGSYRPFNELLCLGYMEKQAIGWHDDGEKDLGPDIASLSLGGAATMTFRMKAKHWLAKNLSSDNYDPELPVQTGSQAYQFRNIVNEHYKAGRMAEYERTKAELLKYYNKDEKKKKHAPTSLTLELKHGDMVVMHGAEIQKIWEHSVVPKGKLRYGLTGRYIKPENIPPKEHWKGEFSIPPENVYKGDLALFKIYFPDDEEEA